MTSSPSEAAARIDGMSLDELDAMCSERLFSDNARMVLQHKAHFLIAEIRRLDVLLEEARRVVEPFAALALPEDETGTPDDKIGQQKPLPYPVRQNAIRAGRAFLEKLGSET